MTLNVRPGDCYLLNLGDSGRHFFFVISAPEAHPDAPLVLVSMTSVSPDKNVDAACLLSPGDHAHCIRESFIFYRGAIALKCARLQEMLEANEAAPRPPASARLLQRMRDGACASEELRTKFLKELRNQGILPGY